MKVVSVINFKGGVGKTTLSLHLASFLAKTHNVLLIDIDHQSSLSIVLLGASKWEELVATGMTINSVFESYSNRKVAMPGNEIIVNFPSQFRKAMWPRYDTLDFVCAQFELDDTEIDLASTNYGNVSQSEWEKRTLLPEWLDQISADERYDYVIIDCPPATKIVSQNAIASSHGVIVPVIPDEMSSRGVTHFASLIKTKVDDKLAFLKEAARIRDEDVPSSYVETTSLAAIVPSIIKTAGNAASGMTNIHTQQLAALKRQWGASVLEKMSKNYIGVPEATNAGKPVWDYWGQNSKPKVKRMMRGVCQALQERIDRL